MRFFMGLGLLILLSSCASSTTNYYTPTIQSWHGSNAGELIKRWGYPDQMITNSKGNTIYTYKTESYHYAYGAPPVGLNVSPTSRPTIIRPNNGNFREGAKPLTCFVSFEANRAGKIIDSEWQGNGCFGNSEFAKRLKHQ